MRMLIKLIADEYLYAHDPIIEVYDKSYRPQISLITYQG